MASYNGYCSVPHCNSWAKRDPEKKLTFHRFPEENDPKVYFETEMGRELISRRKAWILKVRIGKPISKFMRVCSLHFKQEDYINKGENTRRGRVLKKTAVPSQKLPASVVTMNSKSDSKRVERLSKRKSGECSQAGTSKEWNQSDDIQEAEKPVCEKVSSSESNVPNIASSTDKIQRLVHDSEIQRAKRNNAKKRKAEPALVEKTVLGKQESIDSCDFTNKAATNQAEKKLPTTEKKLPKTEKKLSTSEKKLLTAKEKLRSAAKANANCNDFDPLDLNNLLLSTTSIFQGMCKELELSTIMNKHVDFLNMDKERITLTTSGGDSKQSLQIVIVNKNREDATPSFSESTDDLERMLTDVESTVMSAEAEYQETLDTRTMSTQTDNRPLEMENKRLKLENAALKNRILCLENQIQQQDVPKLLVVCDDE